MTKHKDVLEAERRIREAIATWADRLSLLGLTGVTSLSDLDVDIAGATSLKTLYLDGTQITDLSPIAGLNAITTLNLSGTQVTDLSQIAGLHGIMALALADTHITDLSPIAGLNAITALNLDDTNITDFSPLSGLQALRYLYLENTAFSDLHILPRAAKFHRLDLKGSNVTDLRPLRDLTFEGDFDEFTLPVTDTPAARSDPKIAEIDAMKDHEERVKALLAYLKDWVPPGETDDSAPKQDPNLSVFIANGKIDLDTITPDALDALKATLHARLKKSSETLSKAAGNQFPRLCEAARAIQKDVDTPFEDIDLITLFLDGEILKDWMDAGQEDGMDFPEEITIPLAGTNRDITGLTLGDPQIDTLAERLDRAKNQPAPAEDVSTHDQMGQAIQNNPESMGPDIRRVEEKLDQLSEQVALATRKPMHRNVLWTIATFAGAVPVLAVQGIGVEVLSLEIKAFAAQNWPIIAATAESFGLRFANWFASSCAQAPELTEYAKAMLRRGTDKSEPDDAIH